MGIRLGYRPDNLPIAEEYSQRVLRLAFHKYKKALGGGALLDAGCYTLHAASCLTGDEPNFLSVCLGSEAGYEVDTTGSALIVFKSGSHALLDWGFGHAYVNEIEIWGERGRVRAERALSKPPSIAPRLFYISAILYLRRTALKKFGRVRPRITLSTCLNIFLRQFRAKHIENRYSRIPNGNVI